MNTDPLVLIVDDEINICQALLRVLRSTNYSIQVANSGRAALRMMQDVDYNLVISDLKMPEMDGVEFLSMATELFPRTSQILLSGHADRDALGQAINQCDIKHFISKPWNKDDLISMVEQIVKENEYQRFLQHNVTELDQELDTAANMQLSLLPGPIDTNQVQLNWLYKTCTRLGGDSFGYTIEGNILYFHLIDVVGHGAPAAMESFALQHLISNLQFLDPAKIAAHMNTNYAYKSDAMRYFTLLCGNLNLESGDLVFCQAGHPSPLIVRASSITTEKPGEGGFPIGLVDNALYENVHCHLNPDDLLILCSDGFVDEDTSDLENVVAQQGNVNCDLLQKKLIEWRADHPIRDDISALFINLR